MADDALSSNVARACEICGNSSGLKQCSRCKLAVYCSREHQAKHWPIHKQACKSKRVEPTVPGTTVESKTPENRKILVEPIESDTVNCDRLNTQHNKNDSTSLDKKDSVSDKNSFFEFDSRPFKSAQFDTPPSYDKEDIATFIITSLHFQGYCVVDGIFKKEDLDKVVKEFSIADDKGMMKSGQLAGGRTSGDEDLKVTKSGIRSDKIAWVDGTESDVIPATCEVLRTVDDITARFNQYLLGEYLIKGRTKVSE